MELRNFDFEDNPPRKVPSERSARKTRQPRETKNKERLSEHEQVSDILAPSKSEKETVTASKPGKSENIHKNHRARLKEQCIKSGFESLTDIQKLELLLFYAIPQRDTNPLAHSLIDEFGSLSEVLQADPDELCKVKGIKESSALLISIVRGLMHYNNMPKEEEYINCTTDARTFCAKLYVGVPVEQFYVICLTKSNLVKKLKLINTGTMDEVNVQIRDVTDFALKQHCNRIIISHNHPVGNASMSDDDIKITYSLMCSCLLNNIDIVDHIVVGNDRVSSFAEYKLMDAIRERAAKNVQLPQGKRAILAENSKFYNVDSTINV